MVVFTVWDSHAFAEFSAKALSSGSVILLDSPHYEYVFVFVLLMVFVIESLGVGVHQLLLLGLLLLATAVIGESQWRMLLRLQLSP